MREHSARRPARLGIQPARRGQDQEDGHRDRGRDPEDPRADEPAFAPARAASSRRLNILSIRSVIRKPPTTFVDEQATAMVPRMVLSGL